jgi:hypothetical protein
MKPFPVLAYLIGLDLGRDRDHSAFAVFGLAEENFGGFDHVRYCYPKRAVLTMGALKRIPLGTEYVEVVQKLRQLVNVLRAPYGFGQRPPRIHVVLDAAGPGQVVAELIRAAKMDVNIVPVVITAGSQSGHNSRRTTVPRRDLIAQLRYLLETQIIRVHRDVRHATELEREIAAVRPRSGQTHHDDLAIAASLAAWHAAKLRPDLIKRSF